MKDNSLDSFFSAVARGDIEAVRHAITSGFNINQTDPTRDFRYSALTRAFEFRQSKVVKLLLNSGAHFLGSHVIWAVEIAIEEDSLDYFLAIVEAGGDINLWQSGTEESFLNYAIWRGRFNVVKALIQVGADVNKVDERGRYALGEAVQHGCLEIYEYLFPLTAPELQKSAQRLLKQQ